MVNLYDLPKELIEIVFSHAEPRSLSEFPVEKIIHPLAMFHLFISEHKNAWLYQKKVLKEWVIRWDDFDKHLFSLWSESEKDTILNSLANRIINPSITSMDSLICANVIQRFVGVDEQFTQQYLGHAVSNGFNALETSDICIMTAGRYSDNEIIELLRSFNPIPQRNNRLFSTQGCFIGSQVNSIRLSECCRKVALFANFLKNEQISECIDFLTPIICWHSSYQTRLLSEAQFALAAIAPRCTAEQSKRILSSLHAKNIEGYIFVLESLLPICPPESMLSYIVRFISESRVVLTQIKLGELIIAVAEMFTRFFTNCPNMLVDRYSQCRMIALKCKIDSFERELLLKLFVTLSERMNSLKAKELLEQIYDHYDSCKIPDTIRLATISILISRTGRTIIGDNILESFTQCIERDIGNEYFSFENLGYFSNLFPDAHLRRIVPLIFEISSDAKDRNLIQKLICLKNMIPQCPADMVKPNESLLIRLLERLIPSLQLNHFNDHALILIDEIISAYLSQSKKHLQLVGERLRSLIMVYCRKRPYTPNHFILAEVFYNHFPDQWLALVRTEIENLLDEPKYHLTVSEIQFPVMFIKDAMMYIPEHFIKRLVNTFRILFNNPNYDHMHYRVEIINALCALAIHAPSETSKILVNSDILLNPIHKNVWLTLEKINRFLTTEQYQIIGQLLHHKRLWHESIPFNEFMLYCARRIGINELTVPLDFLIKESTINPRAVDCLKTLLPFLDESTLKKLATPISIDNSSNQFLLAKMIRAYVAVKKPQIDLSSRIVSQNRSCIVS